MTEQSEAQKYYDALVERTEENARLKEELRVARRFNKHVWWAFAAYTTVWFVLFTMMRGGWWL